MKQTTATLLTLASLGTMIHAATIATQEFDTDQDFDKYHGAPF